MRKGQPCRKTTSTLDLHLSGREPTGTVTLAGRTLEVTSIRSTKGTWDTAEPVGFRVDGPQGPVGAVEVLRPGQLWLSRKLGAEERRELACLLAGVMLHVEEWRPRPASSSEVGEDPLGAVLEAEMPDELFHVASLNLAVSAVPMPSKR